MRGWVRKLVLLTVEQSFDYNHARNKTDWKTNGKKLRQSMTQERTPVTIDKVMTVFGYTSKASAANALIQLAKIGVVEWLAGKWYLKGGK